MEKYSEVFVGMDVSQSRIAIALTEGRRVGAPDGLNRTHAEPRRLRHQGSGPVGRLAARISEPE